MTAPLMLKYKFYFMFIFFVSYTLIETALMIGYAMNDGKYYSITKEEYPILNFLKSVINGGFEPWMYRVATLVLELNH